LTRTNPLLLADVNVYLYAHRRESERHAEYRAWLEDRLSGAEPFGVSELVLSSFVRIVTNRRVYLEPATPVQAMEFCDVVLAAPAAVPLRPGARHWGIFAGLVRDSGARANLVPDAFLAALALEHGATWVTNDAGYRRFPGLTVRSPLAG
jgi:toxin-antitoxin system PIN domain toxin